MILRLVHRAILMLALSLGSFASAQTLPIQWQRVYAGPVTNGSDVGVAAAVGPDGHVVVAGNSAYATDRVNIYLAKYDAQTGAVIWSARSPGNQRDTVAGMVLDAAGDVIVAGARDFSTPGGTAGREFYVGKYRGTNGALIWQRIFDGGANERDYFNAVALDAQGNVVATGLSRRTSFSPIESDIHTYKFDAATGVPLWQNIVGTRPGFTTSDEGRALVLDASGEVFVTGYADHQQSGTIETLTFRINGATGALVWQKPYRESGYVGGAGRAIKVNAAGDVFVASSSGQAFQGGSLRVLKYRRSDGLLLWVNAFDGSTGQARDLAINEAGDPVVVGHTRNAAGHEDFFTRKVNGATGATLWTRLYDAGNTTPGLIKDDEASAVVFDPAGNPIVAGYARYSSNGDLDFAILKYRSTDGTTLAQQRIAVSGGDDYPSGPGALVAGPGHITVTGQVRPTFSNQDMVTIRLTNGSAPTVQVSAATNVRAASATLNGSVTPNSAPTTARFEYSTDPAFAAGVVATPNVNVGSGIVAVPLSAPIAGLSAGTTYYARVVAQNVLGTRISTVGSFTTNTPPAGGAITLSPEVAAPGAMVGVSATGWTDPNTPLTYQFFLDGAPLGPAGHANSTSLTAPTAVGTYLVKVRVADALGDFAEATASLVVNHPPVIRAATLGAVGGSTAEVAVAKLLRYASDPDGDAMQVIAVSPASAQGGAVALLDGVIHYTAAAGYSGADSFTYTVRDASGSVATGVVNVTVAAASASSLNVVSITPTAAGFLVRFAGIPGESYQIQYRDTLTAPWQLLTPPGIIPAGPNGIFEHEDKPNPKPASRFYRAVAP